MFGISYEVSAILRSGRSKTKTKKSKKKKDSEKDSTNAIAEQNDILP